MKAVIFAGGLGLRMRTFDADLPKPLIRVQGLPILAHVMSIYLANGIDDFLILGGYRCPQIVDYFLACPHSHSERLSDGVRLQDVRLTANALPCLVRVLDSGEHTPTGGRLWRARHLLTERFCLTYGDSLVDFHLADSLAIHESHQALVTLCSYRYPFPYGTLTLTGAQVSGFAEKQLAPSINAGFFIVEPEVLAFIKDESSVFETDVLPLIAAQGRLFANQQVRFWQPMDTPEHHATLEKLAATGAPWLAQANRATVAAGYSRSPP